MDELIAIRRDLHAHPELGGAEHRTTRVLAERLRRAGLEPYLLPGTGLWCDIGSGDPLVAVRADIDALPMDDAKDVDHRSRVEGVAHACGHDVHATIVLGCALALAERPPTHGRVRCIFQPAEEILPGGALDVIDAGALEGVSAIFALHCDPRDEVGSFAVRSGPITAAADSVTIRLTGPGGHTARPHLTADLVSLAGRVASELPSRLARATDPRAGLVFVFGSIHAGSAANVIPRTAELSGTLRVLDHDTWAAAPKLVEQLVAQVAAGAEVEVEHTRGVPPVDNDPEATRLLGEAAREVVGDDRVGEAAQSMGAEDFSWYLEHVPGSYGRLGVAPPGTVGEWPDLHSPRFDVDERAIRVGVGVLTAAARLALTSQ